MNETAPVRRRWPGSLLSVVVPGFGLVRAGRPLRGIAWFIGLQLLGCAIALMVTARAVPVWLVCVAFVASFLPPIALLVDSFRPGRMNWRLTLLFVIVGIASLFLPSLPQSIAGAYKTPTGAMEPTLRGASAATPDHFIVDRLSYRFTTPRRGDLVVFRTTGIAGIPGEAIYVKRLVGLPGERIEIRGGHVFADGRQLSEADGIPPITYISTGRVAVADADGNGNYTVPADGLFVLGDNSAHSYDSRYWRALPRANVIGRVALIYWPAARLSRPH